MLNELKFVQGAVSRKDLLPVLTHFQIQDGRASGYNGVIGISTPIEFKTNCRPNAVKMVRAISKCEGDNIQLELTKGGRLKVESGKFRAFVECIDQEFPTFEPCGEHVAINGEALIRAFTSLQAFVGDDASRPWTNGILLRDQSAYATNNVCLVEHWIRSDVPFEANIPAIAIRELLRVKEIPVSAQIDTNSITFHYSDGKWIRSQLLSLAWPDFKKLLDVEHRAQVLHPDFFRAVESLRSFVDAAGRIYFEPGRISTHEGEGEGARYELDGFNYQGVFNVEMLRLLDGVADLADFTQFPKPCPFFGTELRGVIIGMKY